ncbi:MAG TPA: valine--tRNA ligase [Limnochordia bacterium]
MTLTKTLAKTYDPRRVEQKWYQLWEAAGYFRAAPAAERTPFCIVIPPPNVTGSLHMGHALDQTLQDLLIRWRRMQGYEALWVPGTDHAGIATQIKVEERLRAEEGKSRHDLGREAFLARVWEWKEQYHQRITSQMRRLGASCDWARERFTLDEGCSRAVRTVFVRLFDKGWIYRGDGIVHWCPECRTTLSDIEVEHVETDGKLYHLRYPFADGSGHLTVATTRPETMLGDTAVAAHPDDRRYQRWIGKTVRLPLVGREIPVIADPLVDPAFGTGLVKVTPAHDPDDFAMGRRHDLPEVRVIGEDGRMTEAAGAYAGLDRYAARERIVADLAERGLVAAIEPHHHAVGHCYRCGTPVEPLLSRQWYVKMAPLAGPAIAAVREGRIRFHPRHFEKMYLNWMENIRDWCISRQLWWGHRIPVWTCTECGEVFAALEDPQRCRRCHSGAIEQDPDVLDTWFSSALWPFSTLGWPEKTPELDYFYPTSVLVTGFDIIIFWVARMIFMSLEFTGEIPFRDVFVHGLVRDAKGRKMSKSLGNGVDPLEVIDAHGADALRFMLVTGTAPGNDTRYQPEKVEAARNFANKVWNASRFALLNLEGFTPQSDEPFIDEGPAPLADRWILSRYNRLVRDLTAHLERYDPGEGAKAAFDFVWSEFCDWYIEIIKPRLYHPAQPRDKASAQQMLWYVLKHTLELLHPYMPFVTEEIWQHLPGTGETIMRAKWPVHRPEWDDPAAEAEMADVMAVVRAIRNVRAEYQVPPGREVPAIATANGSRRAWLQAQAPLIRLLARLSELSVQDRAASAVSDVVTAVAAGIRIDLPLRELVDVTSELDRLEKERAAAEAELARSRRLLANAEFTGKAPAAVVNRERQKEAALAAQVSQLADRLKTLRRLAAGGGA